MPAKKMRVEVFDEQGNRYTVAFEGKITREKALGLLDIMELLGGVHNKQEVQTTVDISKFDKTKSLLEKYFPFIWFSSKNVLDAYEKEFNEPMSLSTVSTYLARMADRGYLLRRGSASGRTYMVATKLAQNNPSIAENR
jgi:hypothetical protein